MCAPLNEGSMCGDTGCLCPAQDTLSAGAPPGHTRAGAPVLPEAVTGETGGVLTGGRELVRLAVSSVWLTAEC